MSEGIRRLNDTPTSPSGQLPYSIEVEEWLLGSVLLEPECWARVKKLVKATDFFREKNERVWEVWQQVAKRHKFSPYDALPLLKDIGVEADYFYYLLQQTPTAVSAEHYARTIAHLARQRETWTGGEESQLREESKRKVYLSARFPGLVDIILNAGRPRYLVKGSELEVKDSVETPEAILEPPSFEHLPWLLPRWEAVKEYISEDSPTKLFEDALNYGHKFGELPSDAYCILAAAWMFSTFLIDWLPFSGYLWLYGDPETGKTQIGKALTYASYRGIRSETLREADLFRHAEDRGASLFLDVVDVWKKAKYLAAEDILLNRYERGSLVARVIYLDRGPFRDTRFFRTYGPTLIATNQEVPDILETRCFPIAMAEAGRNFPEPTPEEGLPFRERLVAWKIKMLDTPLPEAPELSIGRLRQIAFPLWQVIKTVGPEYLSEFEKLIKQIHEEKVENKQSKPEAKIVAVLKELEPGRVTTASVQDQLPFPENTLFTVDMIGRILRRLGYQGCKVGGVRGFLHDAQLTLKLANKYGLGGQTSVPSVPSVPSIAGGTVSGEDSKDTKDAILAPTFEVEEALKMSIDEALSIWKSQGAPVIYLGPGENCHDLAKLLQQGRAKREHLSAIRQWLEENLMGEGE